jgi:hypothetical protein
MAPFAPSWESTELLPAISGRKTFSEAVRFSAPQVTAKHSTLPSPSNAVENMPANHAKQASISQRVTADLSIH